MTNETKNFGAVYSGAYDSIYKEKNYEEECDFLETIFKANGKEVKTILDLGCGTGGHARILAKRGYQVMGVDISESMLKIAKKKAADENLNINFVLSPLQNFKTDEKFDAVISMFAVMGYLIKNEDFAAGVRVAHAHLNDGGVFVFDGWNGFAVLRDRPSPKSKEMIEGNRKIIRKTTTDIHLFEHYVNVIFDLSIFDGEKLTSETHEVHPMRFFFPQEVSFMLKQAGFKEIQFCPFLKYGEPLQENDWNLTVIGKN